MADTFTEIHPGNTVFALVSFEGPDRYSLAGGLGVRVTELSEALAAQGFETHLLFVGGPELPQHELCGDGRHFWRCCQHLSERYPAGVYQGEDEKLSDFERTVPPLLLNQIARPAQQQGKLLVVLGEDWQSARTISAIHDLLYWQGLRNHSLILWNANSVFGFDRIEWGRLQATARITTVSRYMRQILWRYGVQALVLPNGIPERHLAPVPNEQGQALLAPLGERLLLTKFARFDPDKNWLSAVQATARLKALGKKPLFLMRGGVEGHGWQVLNEVENLGLRRTDVQLEEPTLEHCLAAIHAAQDEADVLLFRFYVPESVQRLLYRASDAVLANSIHEPFGLVGLEVMGAGGVAVVGATGEDYAQHLLNAIALDTTDPNELVGTLLYLQSRPEVGHDLRRLGRITARFYIWPRVIEKLTSKLQYLLAGGGTTWP